MAHGNGTTATLELAALIEGGTVACAGTLGDVTEEQLREVVEEMGGRLVPLAAEEPVDVLIVGEGAPPLTAEGDPAVPLARSTQTRVVTEGQFLYELKIATDAGAPRLFTVEALAELLREPLARVRAWYRSGLILPATVQHGIPRFEFRQVAAARMLATLAAAGVSAAKMRNSLQLVRKWLPDLRRPLEQLDLLEHSGELLVRLEAGELAEIDGQLRLPYEPGDDEEPAPPLQLRLVPETRTAADWHEQGVDQERHGLFADAEASYRRALLEGGPEAQICFDLAHVLQAQGNVAQSAERYRQVLELDPRRSDAWNNLGVVLAELGRHEEAVDAFRQVLRLDSRNADAEYNLAQALESAGRPEQARDHWRQYLKLDPGPSPWSAHARRRAGAR